MGTSVKAVVQLFLLVAVLLSIILWFDPGRAGPIEWSLRIVAPIVAAATIWILIRDANPKETLLLM